MDLEFAILELMGKVNVPRGLSKIVTLCMPELNVRIEKPKTQKGRYKNIGPFALIEQGKAEPLRGLFDLQEKDQQYAALDSWCTLKAYQELLQLIEQK